MRSPVADSPLPPIRVAEHTSTLGFWGLATLFRAGAAIEAARGPLPPASLAPSARA
jgi:hypothetical protein